MSNALKCSLLRWEKPQADILIVSSLVDEALPMEGAYMVLSCSYSVEVS